MSTKTREKKPVITDKVNAFQKPVQPSEELAAIVGSAPLPRTQVVSKIWDYIRSHKLQNSETVVKSSPTTSSVKSSERTR
jgi:chromatin remodeling complex protein RSC6